MAATGRLITMLAADVVGYSGVIREDETGILERLEADRHQLVYPRIAEHHGRIVRTSGDSLLVEFASATEAVRCAVEVQRGIIDRNIGISPDRRITFRVGIGYPYTTDNQVDDLDAVITQLGLGQVVLVAHDASGPPAIDWALAYPERVAGLVLLNTYYCEIPTLRRPEAIWLFSTPVIRSVARPVRPAGMTGTGKSHLSIAIARSVGGARGGIQVRRFIDFGPGRPNLSSKQPS